MNNFYYLEELSKVLLHVVLGDAADLVEEPGSVLVVDESVVVNPHRLVDPQPLHRLSNHSKMSNGLEWIVA